MWRIVLMLLTWLSLTAPLDAQTVDARRILKRFEAARPTERELTMYKLDWASSLNEAMRRAMREGRPIFLIIIHARYGDIHSGHC